MHRPAARVAVSYQRPGRAASAGVPPASPSGLRDSHIEGEAERREAAFDGLELEPSFEHDDGSWLAVVAGPAAKARADPAGEGERAFRVGVLLALGPALK